MARTRLLSSLLLAVANHEAPHKSRVDLPAVASQVDTPVVQIHRILKVQIRLEELVMPATSVVLI